MDNNTFINSHLEGTGYKGTDTSLHRVETRVDKSGESFVVETKLANGCIIGLKHIIRDNGAEIEDKLSLVALADGKASPQFEINRKDLENNLMQYVPLNFRPTVGGNAKAYIVDSIRAQAVNMSELTVYQHTGWRIINDKPVFLNASGAIGMDGVTVDLEGRLSKYRFSEEKHEERWKTLKLFTEVAPHSVTYPLLAIAALSPLNEFLRQAGIEPAFVPFLIGKTGTKKSTLAALTLCFFGDFDNKSLPGSSKDTSHSLEKIGFLLKDVLTVIDDFHPSASRADVARMEKTAQDILRNYGDRTGRNRMNADGSLRKNYPVRGNAILTGEDVPSVSQSGEARFIAIELMPDDVDNKTLSKVQKNSIHLNECMCDYIEWLSTMYNELPNALKTRFWGLREQIQDNGHGRITEAITHLQIALEMWTLFLQRNKHITEKAATALKEESLSIFKAMAVRQNKAITEEKPTELFLSALREMLSTRKAKLLDTSSGMLPEEGIGWKDDNFAYLLMDSAYNAVCRFYRERDKSFPLSKRRLLKHFATEKLIIPSEDNTKQKKLGGKNRRVVWLYMDALEEKIEKESETDE